jgi:hypothetical protein
MSVGDGAFAALAACFMPELKCLAAATAAAALGIAAALPLTALGCFSLGLWASCQTPSLSRERASMPQSLPAARPPPPPPPPPPAALPPKERSASDSSGSLALSALKLSPATQAAVQRLSERLPPEYSAASRVITACRFLIGRKGDEIRAAHAIDEYVRWRATLEGEPVHSPEVELAISQIYSPTLLHTRDARGRPVVIAKIGRIDVCLAASRNISISMLLRRHISTLDKINAAIEASPEPLAGHLLIQDLAGCSVSKFVRARTLFKRMLRIDQLYYPEMLGDMVCLHAPKLATWAFGQIRTWIDPTTADKITVTQDGYAEVFGSKCSQQLIDEIVKVVSNGTSENRQSLQKASTHCGESEKERGRETGRGRASHISDGSAGTGSLQPASVMAAVEGEEEARAMGRTHGRGGRHSNSETF